MWCWTSQASHPERLSGNSFQRNGWSLVKCKIYQVFYDEKSGSSLDSGYVPFDNSSPERLHEFEYGVMRRLYFGDQFQSARYYGVLSWKFQQKTGWSSQRLFQAVEEHPSADVFVMNPYPQSDYFHNVWLQGEACHPGLQSLAQHLFDICGLDQSMLERRMDHRCECYCNYWIATRRFWNLYISLSEKVYRAIESGDRGLKAIVFEGVRDRRLKAPYFPFLFERMFSTVLAAYGGGFNVCPLRVDNRYVNRLSIWDS